MLKRIWQWLKEHFVGLPEPEITKEKQADNEGGAVGFKFKF